MTKWKQCCNFVTMAVFNSLKINETLALIMATSLSDSNDTIVSEPGVPYGMSFDVLLQDDFRIMQLSSLGISQDLFYGIKDVSPFSLDEWAAFLHISKRTIMRHKNDQKSFEALSSDRIIVLSRLLIRGAEVFGTVYKFNLWLRSPVFALGGELPFNLLKSATGIQVIIDELGRIEHGILA